MTTDQPPTAELDDVAAMRLALAAAREAGRAGDVPVGAVAVREAAATLGTWRLDGVTVVVTLEPCAMCAGALVAARVARLVIGALDPKAGAAGSLYNLLCDPRLNHEVAVTSGVEADACAEVLRAFFADRR